MIGAIQRRISIWLHEYPDAKPRPVPVVTRNAIIPLLDGVVVAPITSTIRHAPAELPVDQADGLDHESVGTFDSLVSVRKLYLTHRLGGLGVRSEAAICAALKAMADC